MRQQPDIRKLTHEQYQRYLLKCRRSYKGYMQNADAVFTAERTAALTHSLFSVFFFRSGKQGGRFVSRAPREHTRKDFQRDVVAKLASTRLPFRQSNDPLFSNLPAFQAQFQFAEESFSSTYIVCFILFELGCFFSKLGLALFKRDLSAPCLDRLGATRCMHCKGHRELLKPVLSKAGSATHLLSPSRTCKP